MAGKKWKRPDAPPPPLYFNDPERDFVKGINDEIIEKMVGQQIIYFPLDVDSSSYHDVYGESVSKRFKAPIHVHALIAWEGFENVSTSVFGPDKIGKLILFFHKRRLEEDQDLYIRVGDFIRYGKNYFELTKLADPKLLFGNVNHRFEITANAIEAREDIFSHKS